MWGKYRVLREVKKGKWNGNHVHPALGVSVCLSVTWYRRINHL